MSLSIVPNSGQSLNQTRDPIRLNFTALQSTFVVNHGDFGAANAGQHTMLTMPSGTVIPVTNPDQIILYAADGTGSGETELWMRREDGVGGFGIDVCLTESKLIAGGGYWTMLPSGAILECGVGNSSVAVNLGNTYATIHAWNVTPLGAKRTATMISSTPSSFIAAVYDENFNEVFHGLFYYQLVGQRV